MHSFSASVYEQVEIIAGQTPDKRADGLGGHQAGEVASLVYTNIWINQLVGLIAAVLVAAYLVWVSLKRRADGVAVIVFGNADPALLAAQAAVAAALG